MRSAGNARKAGGPALASALLFAGMLAIGALDALLDLRLDAPVAVAYDLVVVAVAGWLTLDLLAGRWTEATVADLVSQLGDQDDTRGVRAALRRALGDPDLALGYRVPGEEAYVDDDGLPVDVRPAGDQVATVVEDEGVPVAVLVHAASVLDDPELARASVAAVRLAVGNVALRAQVAAQTRELTRARRGLVESADRQRVAVARALEEGTEQRLARVADLVAGLGADDLTTELDEARQDLRALAAGVRPRELEAAGLAGAVTALSVRSAAPTTLDLRIGRVPPAVESALYFVCAEALTNVAKHAGAGSVTIRADELDGWAEVRVADDGNGRRRLPGFGTARTGRPGRGARGSAGGRRPARSRHHRHGPHPGRGGAVTVAQGGDRRRLDDRARGSGPAPGRGRAHGGGHRRGRRGAHAGGGDEPRPGRRGGRHPDAPHADRRGHHGGAAAAHAVPRLGILVLSQHLESHYATTLLTEAPEHAGYLLKDRVSDVAVLVDALRRVVEGECVVDPTIVSRLMRARTAVGPLDRLTTREREVLALMAEGRSNAAIADQLGVGDRTLEAHVRQIFLKLDLPPSPDDHRRVLAVLSFLQSAGG